MKKTTSNKPLFNSGDRQYFAHDVLHALKAAGIKQGDDIFVHSDLSLFGKLADKWTKDDFANCYIDTLLQAVGKQGTVIVPTYTYSYCKGTIFDPNQSPSTVGIMTEVFRNRPDSLRSFHPIFSVASIGKNAKKYVSDVGIDGFGQDSVFDRLLKRKNTKYVILGVPYFSCNIVHLIERVKEVPYRFLKNFKGVSIINSKEQSTTCEYYVRHLDNGMVPSFDKIEQHLLNAELMKKVKLGSGWISVTSVSDIYTEGLKLLGSDPFAFLENDKTLASNN